MRLASPLPLFWTLGKHTRCNTTHTYIYNKTNYILYTKHTEVYAITVHAPPPIMEGYQFHCTHRWLNVDFIFVNWEYASPKHSFILGRVFHLLISTQILLRTYLPVWFCMLWMNTMCFLVMLKYLMCVVSSVCDGAVHTWKLHQPLVKCQVQVS